MGVITAVADAMGAWRRGHLITLAQGGRVQGEGARRGGGTWTVSWDKFRVYIKGSVRMGWDAGNMSQQRRLYL